jgi:hypothetical protein
MTIYDWMFLFYGALAALLYAALCVRWHKRTHIEKKSPARALQGEVYPDDLGIEAIVQPRPKFGLLDPEWKYVPSVETDVRKTWDKYRPLDPKVTK